MLGQATYVFGYEASALEEPDATRLEDRLKGLKPTPFILTGLIFTT